MPPANFPFVVVRWLVSELSQWLVEEDRRDSAAALWGEGHTGENAAQVLYCLLKQGTMTKASRLIRLITLLRSHRSMSCARLARELGVSERTVYRDIDSLSEVNVPVYYDGSGYHLQDNSFLPILNLDTEEYFLLKTLLEAPPSQATAETRSIVKQLSDKLDAVLNATVKEARKTRQSSSRIMVKSSYDPQAVEQWMPVLCQAIKKDRLVEIEYDSLGRGKGIRELEPYQILFRGRAFYLIGYSLEHREYRLYRLDRISNVAISKNHFFPRTDYNPERLLAGSTDFDGDANWYDVEVIFRGRAAKVISTGKRFDGEQITEIADGAIRYTVRVCGLSEIGVWISGYGVEAEVISPEPLRARFAETGRYYAEIYGSPAAHHRIPTPDTLRPDRINRLASLKQSGGE